MTLYWTSSKQLPTKGIKQISESHEAYIGDGCTFNDLITRLKQIQAAIQIPDNATLESVKVYIESMDFGVVYNVPMTQAELDKAKKSQEAARARKEKAAEVNRIKKQKAHDDLFKKVNAALKENPELLSKLEVMTSMDDITI